MANPHPYPSPIAMGEGLLRPRLLEGTGARQRVGWAVGLAACGGADRGQDGGQVVTHLLVAEAQDVISGGGQERLSRGVVFALRGVNRAIELDDQPPLRAAEIDHERADRVLAAELQLFQLPVSDSMPEHRLHRRGPGTQRPRRRHILPMPPPIICHGASVAKTHATGNSGALTPTLSHRDGRG
jgi:hypothetical protein